MATGPKAGPLTLGAACRIAAARSQLWVREASGRNDGVQVERYLGGRKERGLPWCAAFALWVCEQAGTPLHSTFAERFQLRAVDSLERKAGRYGWLYGRFAGLPGDVILYKDRAGSDAGPGRHCGIVESLDDDCIHTVEGNVGDRVKMQIHGRDDPLIAGFVRPPEGA